MATIEEKIVDGVIFRATTEIAQTIFGTADTSTNDIWWAIYSSTWYNTNTGK